MQNIKEIKKIYDRICPILLQLYGARLKKFRKGLGLYQKQIGAILGCSAQHVSNLEHGKRKPTFEIRVLLSIIFEIPYNKFTEVGNFLKKPEDIS
jgi:transcriptional regulator with XRE-family HTH domain